ncbi:MAG TPA: MoxR family ATPase, partial [Anaerolineae bacterium]|nr:MoxR family ATPase [Anaerolineae bacterium]
MMSNPTLSIDDFRTTALAIEAAVGRVIVGQQALVRHTLITLLAGGNALLEGVPGLGKTALVRTLAEVIACHFSRIQFTPDLMPADIVGTNIIAEDESGRRHFRFEPGPIFANLVLADEINRATPKTQSAMLEAMQERQTTIGGRTYRLPDPFVVLATQNPIEEEGTYVLPQAQLDRFLLKEVVEYPSPDEEFEVLSRAESGAFDAPTSAACTTAEVLRLQGLARRVRVDDAVKRYIVELVNVTRRPADFLSGEQANWIDYGSSPRGALAFQQVARASALLDGRDHVVPGDVTGLRHAVLRHRLILTFEALAERVRPE